MELHPQARGHTLPILIEAARENNYRQIIRFLKKGGDGSKELLLALGARNIQPSAVRVCGVNRGECVWDTVHGLLYKELPFRIELACMATADLCNKSWEGHSPSEYTKMANAGKLSLIFHDSQHNTQTKE